MHKDGILVLFNDTTASFDNGGERKREDKSLKTADNFIKLFFPRQCNVATE
jgi:hypothetical protein